MGVSPRDVNSDASHIDIVRTTAPLPVDTHTQSKRKKTSPVSVSEVRMDWTRSEATGGWSESVKSEAG